ncbi:MAG: hypothetical protein O2821_02710 [Chloroflexi bacterium]|nr:hypothetical protein [Chloroflexota bacterium]MDA1227233.1 hypothetical protein [Chloroflexota bacterium]
MTDSKVQKSGSLRTIMLVLGLLLLASTVAYMQVSEHRAPRPAFADQHSPDRVIASQ